MGKQIFKDNTTYSKEENSVKLNGKGSCVNLIKKFNGRTISKINNEQDGKIIVWPAVCDDGNDDAENQILFDCVFDENSISELKTYNLIGFVGDGNNQIEIRTRFSEGDNDPFLYRMLSVVLSCNLVDLKVGSGSDGALNLIVFLFSSLLRKAVNQGVYRKYVRREYNDSKVKGVIDVSRHIRYNYPSNGKIAYSTREYSYDNDVTQLIRHTIEHIRCSAFGKNILDADEKTKECVEKIIHVTPTYDKSKRRMVVNSNSKVSVHPYLTEYAPLQRLCLAILRGDKMSYGDSKEKIKGFVIDVAWLWEEYVAKLLSSTQLKHCTKQNSDYKLFTTSDGNLVQQIVPDYLDETNKIVADAKYIPSLGQQDSLSAERASAIYYKTIMYMYRFGCDTGLLFYPYVNDTPETPKEYIIKEGCKLIKVGMSIPKIKDDFKLDTYIEDLKGEENSFVAQIPRYN